MYYLKERTDEKTLREERSVRFNTEQFQSIVPISECLLNSFIVAEL